MTNVNAPSGTADTSYTYDLHNNLISVTSDGRTITNTFNALGDHLSQAGPNGTVSYLYDAAGRRERMSWPDGNYVTYSWNVASQLTHIRENGASSGLGVLAAFTYDDQGRRTALTRGNGTQTTYSFEGEEGRAKRIKAEPNGRLASLVEDLSGASADLTVSFDHNHSGQIIERTVSNASYTYAHAITIDTLFDHNGLNQITSADDGTSVLTPSYDARGNLTSYDGRTFGYDTYNRLTSVGGTGGSMSLEYDPLGRLWETSGPSGTARYQYDGAAIIAEYNASGVMQHRWVHGPGMDEPLVRYDGSGMSNKRWLHADERGSIIAHTNTSGSRIQTNTYDAYGNPGASNAGLFQYTGQVWLEDAGVYYYKNRTYHAELGRFMQADPIGHSGGVNLYAYVGGDPVNFTDPWGLEAEVVCEPGDVPDGQGGCKADVIIHGTRPDNDCPPGAICIDGDGIN
ncbi:MAG: hypothetical protein NXI12_13190, partial [Alphaproteobacteria bacterium]|nr:hypothetical protein [Alphaproteobacteria bacterium]